MFELPEVTTLAAQMNATLTGKTIRDGALGNSPHKFVWYNRNHDEFAALTAGKTVGRTAARGRWLLTAIEPGYVLVLGECGGRILYHADATTLPAKFHLHLHFDDDTHLTAMTQMWGAMELYAAGEEQERVYIKDMRPTPVDAAFSLAYFNGLVDTTLAAGKRSVKGLLTQDQLIPGLGNAIAQDIMFRARLHPRHPLDTLTPCTTPGAVCGHRRHRADLIWITQSREDKANVVCALGVFAPLRENRRVFWQIAHHQAELHHQTGAS